MNKGIFVSKSNASTHKDHLAWLLWVHIFSFERVILKNFNRPMPQTKAVKIKNEMAHFLIQIYNGQINGWRALIAILRKDPK